MKRTDRSTSALAGAPDIVRALISLKVYAAADTGVGRHTDDLRALGATCEELLAGTVWARTHDPSLDFCRSLCALLRYFGCAAAETLERECDAPE